VFWCPRCHAVCLPLTARCRICGGPQPPLRRTILRLLGLAVLALVVWAIMQRF
jgi:hypothetical protein